MPMNLLDLQDSELTYCLLRNDFSIELDIPLDSLCPAVGLNMYTWSQGLGYESSSYLNVRLLILGAESRQLYLLARRFGWTL